MHIMERLLAVAEVDVEASGIAVVVVGVLAAVLLAVALVEDVLEPVVALLLRSEPAVQGNAGPSPVEGVAVIPVVTAAEGGAGAGHAVPALTLLAPAYAVAAPRAAKAHPDGR
ncbi:hypothetical protein NUW54_g13743 [Trametes sanguinea]|uniref:Uncharacterized protein n=1 Tax=Trametes sanguinea TaxID=158606 RepID=A0ACC1MIM9_9APHY|nr:hypothetical protein NUW54_g13743 [Trametes sanguinea]